MEDFNTVICSGTTGYQLDNNHCVQWHEELGITNLDLSEEGQIQHWPPREEDGPKNISQSGVTRLKITAFDLIIRQLRLMGCIECS